MGLRINLEYANWLAYVLEPSGEVPSFPGKVNESWMERELISQFLWSLREGFYSSPPIQREFRRRIGDVEDLLHAVSRTPSTNSLHAIREFFQFRPWTALLLPSFEPRDADSPKYQDENGDDEDELFTSPDFLRHIIEPLPNHAGLVLQLQEANYYENIHECANVFPAMQKALADVINWPGILLWTTANNSVFLPMGSTKRQDLYERCSWIFSRLYRSIGNNFVDLKREYLRQFDIGHQTSDSTCHLLQISDVHLGSPEATRRLPRLKQLISDTIEQHGPKNVIPIVSGDILDTPNKRLSMEAREFMKFIRDCSAYDPFFVLGNHDMSEGGFLRRDFRLATQVHPTEIRQYEDHGLTLVGFDSCESGFFAAGRVSEEQLGRLGNEIDRLKKSVCPILIGVVHHHPLPVEWQDWQQVSFVEKLVHKVHEPTVAFQNAAQFLRFVKKRNFAAVLHGHKHIPRIITCPETKIPILGCGSSVGKIPTVDDLIRLSINMVSINHRNRKLTCRLLIETVLGGGLENHRDGAFSIQNLSEEV